MREIFRCQFGSHVYGTNVPTSDLDYKLVFIPEPRDLILQRAKNSIQNNTKKDSSLKNQSTDVDIESFSVQAFTKLLCEGQTVSLDMLFCPESFYINCSPEWRDILAMKDKFLHRGTSAFVGYTRQQAAKYGVKGFRVAALKKVLDAFDGMLNDKHLYEHKQTLLDLTYEDKKPCEHIAFTEKMTPTGKMETYFKVCDREVPLHAKVGYAKSVFQRIYDQYGHRARLAETNEGIDWKALMHAVRVAREAEELLLTHQITFPRPEKDLLLKIRKGEIPYNDVAPIIEEGLERIERAKELSTLPDAPDYASVEDLVYNIYAQEIKEHICIPYF